MCVISPGVMNVKRLPLYSGHPLTTVGVELSALSPLVTPSVDMTPSDEFLQTLRLNDGKQD